MVKVTLERLECDVCGAPAERYAVTYPEGMKILDRCQKHAKKLLAFKEERGEWTAITSRKGKMSILTPEEIESRRVNDGSE